MSIISGKINTTSSRYTPQHNKPYDNRSVINKSMVEFVNSEIDSRYSYEGQIIYSTIDKKAYIVTEMDYSGTTFNRIKIITDDESGDIIYRGYKEFGSSSSGSGSDNSEIMNTLQQIQSSLNVLIGQQESDGWEELND